MIIQFNYYLERDIVPLFKTQPLLVKKGQLTVFKEICIPKHKLSDENMLFKIECHEITKNKISNLIGGNYLIKIL